MSEFKSTRRTALKIAVTAIVAGVVAGVGGFFAGSAAVPPPKTVTETRVQTKTITAPPTTITKTRTVTVTPPKVKEYKIGVLAPLSGPIGPIGKGMVKGAELAAKVINDSGGIAGIPIRLIIEDTKGEPDTGFKAVKKLIEIDGVKLIVGPVTSATMLASAKYINEREVVIIGTVCSSHKISEFKDDYIFRVMASEELASASDAEIIVDKGYKRVALITVADDWGMAYEKVIKDILKDRLIISIRVDPKKGDWRSELTTIKGTNPDVILYAIWVETAKIIFKQADELGLILPTQTAETCFSPEIFKEPRAAEYMIKTNMISTKPISIIPLSYELFVSKFEKMFGEKPGLYPEKYYDAVMLAALAIGMAGVYEGPAIKKAVDFIGQNGLLMGASGYLPLNEVGDLIWMNRVIARAQKVDEKYDFVTIGYWDPVTGIRWV